ncbi:MAG: hypothetical protein R3B70_20820 [Polyangiaceae bacterium]
MIETRSPWWLLERMLEVGEARLGPGADSPFSREQVEAAALPAPLKAALTAHLSAASAIEAESSYAVLETVTDPDPELRVRAARLGEREVQLAAVARNSQLVTADPMVFAVLGESGSVGETPECLQTAGREGAYRATSLGYSLDQVLPWRWAAPFVRLFYPCAVQVPQLEWRGPVDEMASLIDRALGLPPGPAFECGWVVGRIEPGAVWLSAIRTGDVRTVHLGGEMKVVRGLQEALTDAAAKQRRIGPG